MKQLIRLGIAAVVLICLVCFVSEIHDASSLRDQLAKIDQRSAGEKGEIERLNKAFRDTKRANALLIDENTRLQRAVADAKQAHLDDRREISRTDPTGSDPFTEAVKDYARKASLLNQRLRQMPTEKIPELALLNVNDWLQAAQSANLDTDDDVRQSLSKLREIAKSKLPFGSALFSYAHANDGNLPTDMSQLEPYFGFPIDSSVLARYSIVQQGNVATLPQGAWVIVEGDPVDQEYDTQAKFGVGVSTILNVGPGWNALVSRH